MKKVSGFLKNQGIVLIALIGALLLILFSMIGFNMQVNRYIYLDMFSQVEAIQKNSMRLLENEMTYLKRITESAAKNMSQAEYVTDEDIVQALKSYAKSSELSRTLFVTLDGQAYTNYAGYIGQSDGNKFLDGIALSEIKSTIFSKPWYSEAVGEAIFGVAAPVTLGDKKGILVSSYNLAQFYSLLENEFMDGSIEIGILNNKGEVVVGRDMSEFELNIFDALIENKIKFSKHSTEEMQQDFAKGIAGHSSYFVGDVERYCSYAPVKFNDWYVIVMIEESALRNSLLELEQYGVQLTLELVIIMTALLLIIIAARHREQKQIRIILQKAAMLDGLTEIYNRTTVESEISDYLEGDGKVGSHALFIMDVDNFKMLNDSFGHIFGDTVLKEFGERLREIFAEKDVIGRIGGDEFIALIKNYQDVTYLRERANQIIDDFYVNTDTGIEQLVSISIGVALFDSNGRSFMDLYKHADDALYRAKEQGKCRVSF